MGARVAKVALVLTAALVATPSWAVYDTGTRAEYKLDEENLTAEVKALERGKYKGSIRIHETLDYEGLTYTVNSIASQAFKDSPELTELILPETIEYVGSYAFENCTGLTALDLDNYAWSLGAGAFRGCSELTTLTLPYGLSEIGEGCFDGCMKLNNLTLPDYLVAIGSKAFFACESLTYIELPEGIKIIPDYCFHGCKALTAVVCKEDYYGKSIMSIGDEAFAGCTALQHAPMPSSLNSIGKWAFSTCTSLAEAEFPRALYYLGQFAFYGCDRITEVDISTLRAVGEGAFQNCKSLKRVRGANDINGLLGPRPWPQEVTTKGLALLQAQAAADDNGEEGRRSIGPRAFADCPLLEAVAIPAEVDEIGQEAFKNCPKLRSVLLPAAAAEGVDPTAFALCPELRSVVVYGEQIPDEVPAALAAAMPEGLEPQAAILNNDNADSNQEGTDNGRLALKLAMQAAAADLDDAYTLSGAKAAKGHKGIVVKGGKLQVSK